MKRPSLRFRTPPAWALLVAGLAVAHPSPAAGQATTLNYADADIRAVVRSLSAMLGINVLISDGVPDIQVSYSTAVPVSADDVGPVLEAILEAEGLVLVNRGAVAQVLPVEAAPATGPVSSGGALPTPRPVGLVTHIVPLEFINTDEAMSVLEQVAGPLTRIEPLPRSNSLMITEHASNLARFLELLRQIDAATAGEAGQRTYVYSLRHATASELALTLSQLYGLRLATTPERPRVQSLSDQSLSTALEGFRQRDLEALDQRRSQPLAQLGAPAAAVGTEADSSLPGAEAGASSNTVIVADQATNALVIRTDPVHYPVLRQTIEQLDVRPPQVLLEVHVAEVTLDEATQYGINWFAITRDGSDELTARLGRQAFTDSALVGVQDFLLRAVSLGEVDVRAVVRALASTADVRIISTPHIVALNNEEARILVGSQVPFTQSTRTGLDVVVDQVVQYRDVGVQLTVIPTINEDGYVTFRLLQEVSSLTAQNVEAALGASVISTREAETSAIVRNAQTVVIGGLIDESDEAVESGVPLLKDIPLLGYLFKNRSTRTVRTELAIFVTPYVITSDEEADALYQRMRGRMQGGVTPSDTSGVGEGF